MTCPHCGGETCDRRSPESLRHHIDTIMNRNMNADFMLKLLTSVACLERAWHERRRARED